MKKRLVFILSFLLALLVSVGAAIWVIVYQNSSPYPTELSGEFSLAISYDKDLLTAQNGQLKGDLIKAGVTKNDKNATTTLVVNHTTLDGKTYSYPIHQAANVTLTNTEFEYGAAKGEGATFEFTETHSKLTAQENGSATTSVAIKVLLKDNDKATSATQKFLRALLALPAPDTTDAENAEATFNRNGLYFKVTDNRVMAVYANDTATMQAVAYNGDNNYGTIEGALAASTSGTVYVKPQTTVTLGTAQRTNADGSKTTYGIISSVTVNDGVPKNDDGTPETPYIIKNCTILSGVTLCLPWESTKATPSLTNISAHESMTCVSLNPVDNVNNTQLRTNHITVHTGAVLTNYGTFIVGGVVSGGNGGHPSSYSMNQYAQITMKAGAQIVNEANASIQCYGYILEETLDNESQIILHKGSSYIAPFKVIEHRGGSKFLGIYLSGMKCSPFNRFYMPNTSVAITVNNGASVNGYVSLYADSKHNVTVIDLIGNVASALIQFTASTSSAHAKYNPATQVLDLDLFGSAKLNSLALSIDSGLPIIGTVSLSMAAVYFPLTWRFDVSISRPLSGGTATFTTEQDIKIMPGGKLTIGQGVNATMSSIVVYDEQFQDPADPAGVASTKYETGKGAGVLTVNGSLTAKNIAGVVHTQVSNAFIHATEGTTIASNELSTASATSASYEATTSTETLSLSKRSDASANYTAAGTYYSAQRANGTSYGWYKTPYTITLYNASYDSDEPEIITRSTSGGYRPTAKSSNNYYTFDKWYTDSACTQEVTSTVYEDTSYYAKWLLNVYNVQYDYSTSQIENYDPTKLNMGTPITQFSYTNNLNALLHAPIYEGYAFMGWRIGSASGSSTTNLNNAVMTAATKTATNANDVQYSVTLYAEWTTATTYEINLNYDVGANYKGVDDLPTDASAYVTGALPTIDTSIPDSDYETPKYFYGWAKIPNGTVADKVETLTQEDVDNNELTFYAIWLDKHALSFDTITNSGNLPDIEFSNVYLLDGQSYDLSQLKDTSGNTITQYDTVKTANKYFNGWTADANAMISDNSVTATDNATLTAGWIDKYALTIVAQSGATKGTAININTTVYLLESQIDSTFTSYDTQVKEQNTNTATNKYFVSWSDDITSLSKDNFTNKAYTITASWGTKYSVTATTLSSATVTVDCINHDTVTLSRNTAVWYQPNAELTFTVSYSGDNEQSFTVNNGSKDVLKNPENNSGTVKIESNLTVKASSSCITADTLITLADGTQKRVDQLRGDELLLVWNLNTGKYDVAPIVFVDSDPETEYEIVHLYFSDGSDVKVIYEHGFFDLNLRKYVYIDAYNYAEFIGHEFVTQGDISNNSWKKATLTRVVIETERTKAYSPVTFEHLSYYTNGVLSMPGGISGLFNIFEVNTDTMSYDKEQMQKDIETYGLFSYDDFKDLIPEVAFDAFNGKWLKVAIGKGMLTWADIEYLAQRYVPLM